MNPPFEMRKETTMEKYRHETFWTKEPETIEWIKTFEPMDVFFDIGANVGIYSLYAASLFPFMAIYPFEPGRKNFEALQENVEANKHGNIYPVMCAIGKEYGIFGWKSASREVGASGGQVVDEITGRKTIVLSIDGLCFGNHAQYQTRFSSLPVPNHVKIDIDGQEINVLKGMERTLSYVKTVLIEVSSKTKEEITGIMAAKGLYTYHPLNRMKPHSSERRIAEEIDAENIIFSR